MSSYDYRTYRFSPEYQENSSDGTLPLYKILVGIQRKENSSRDRVPDKQRHLLRFTVSPTDRTIRLTRLEDDSTGDPSGYTDMTALTGTVARAELLVQNWIDQQGVDYRLQRFAELTGVQCGEADQNSPPQITHQ
jgi:hypothetical protein